MLTLVIFEFPYPGPWGDEMTAATQDLAHDVAREDGLVWKLWMEAAERGVAGGAYLFTNREAAQRYVDKHTARLPQFGVTNADVRMFDVNADLTAITLGKNPLLPVAA